MAHDNIWERRRHIRKLLQAGTVITPALRRELAVTYGCSVTAIITDIKLFHDPLYHAQFRDMHMVASENGRATRLGVPGRLTATEWKSLCAKHEYACLACYSREPLTIDHILPLSRGGTNTIDNVQPLCGRCNRAKGTQTVDYRAAWSDLDTAYQDRAEEEPAERGP